MLDTKYQVIARRYRPRLFREVVGQEAAVTTLKNALRFGKVAHAYLFCGSRGVGKTTLARLFAKALNCQEKTEGFEPCNQCASCQEISSGQSLDVIEIDGASNRGIDDVRQINETACYSPSPGRYKIYIIDEVHMLTKEAFNALLKTLEEPPERAKFFFATTEPHKVLPTILSRCQRFDLGRIQIPQITHKLSQIATDLHRIVEPEALHLIAHFADGALRDAESLFDRILCFTEETVTAEVVRNALGLISQESLFALDTAFANANTSFAFELVETVFSSGKDLFHFFEQLIDHVRSLSVARLRGENGLQLPTDLAAKYLQACKFYAPTQCLYLLEYLLRAEQTLQKSSNPRTSLEAIVLHYIQSRHRLPVEVLVRRLAELEQALLSKELVPTPKALDQIPAPPVQERDAPTPKTIEPIPVPPRVAVSPPVQKAIAPSPTPELKPTPFSPFKAQVIKPDPLVAPPLPQSLSPDVPIIAAASQSRYDTLMRFASVELEGTLKKD
ncbi:MAG: DNA polymerase III subunit gamma/tau [Chlamydiia bacterium]|nr:DNA polymerase III subunit gamma/tau [Chlamydiia bacterium]